MGGPCICSYSGPAPRLNAGGMLASLGDGATPIEAVSRATECANCFEAFRRQPVSHEGRPYCCVGCAQGGPCICTYAGDAIERNGSATPPTGKPSSRKANRYWDDDATPAAGSWPARANRFWRAYNTPAEKVGAGFKPAPTIKTNRLWDANQSAPPPLAASKPDELGLQAQRPQAPVAERPMPTSRGGFQTRPYETFKLSASPLIELIDVKMFATQLENIPSVERAQLARYQGDRVTFEVEASSVSRLTREIMDIGYFRIRSLRTTSEGVELVLTPKGTDFSGSQPYVQRDERPSPRQTPTPQEGSASRYEMGVDVFFNGRHQVEVGGVKGPVHMHSWRVQAILEGSASSAIGASEVRQIISSFVTPFNEKFLNKTPPFDETMPTDHNIAMVIYVHVAGELEGKGVRLKSIRLWESPTSYVEYSGEG
jgi:6-pyruvoyl-tetrahydropterin synthase